MTTNPANQPAWVLTPDGKMERTLPGHPTETICAIEGDTCTFTTADFGRRYRSRVVQLLSTWQIPVRRFVVPEPQPAAPAAAGPQTGSSQTADAPAPSSGATPVTIEPQPEPTPDHVLAAEAEVQKQVPAGSDPGAGLPPETASAVRKLRAKLGFPPLLERPAPMPPLLDPGHGDKTPAYVEHLLRYFPKAFVSRYGLLREGTVEKVRIATRPNGERFRERYREPGHFLATRATHLTDLPDLAEEAGTRRGHQPEDDE